MVHLLLTTGFGLGIDQSSFTLHEKCLCTSIGFGAVLRAISMYRAGVGL